MYYKKNGTKPPVIRTGCVYGESYYCNGYMYLKYSFGNIPSEELTEITQEEYEANKPFIPQPEPTPPEPLSPTEQTLIQMAVNMEYLATMMEFKQ